MRKLLAVVVATLLLSAGCGRPEEDAQKLRSHLRASELSPRSFVFQEVSEDRAFSVTAEVEDDFRYRMVLSGPEGGIVEYVVDDDALAVRFLDPAVADRIGNLLGHQDVDRALREGRWVVDPSGAPRLRRGESDEDEGMLRDPLRESIEIFPYVRTAMAQAFGVVEFNLESIEYRPSLDPWEYPDRDEGETRFDLMAPALPKNEQQMQGGGGGQIGQAHFRRLSVFVDPRGRVDRICEVVDIRSHEDYRRLEERGPGHNPFQAQLFESILSGESLAPIRERKVYVTVQYPDELSVALPDDAHAGRLEEAKEAMEQAFRGGMLRTPRPPDLTDCDRTEEQS